MKLSLITILTLFLSTIAFADIEPTKGYSQCLNVINTLRVTDINLSEGDNGIPKVRATFTNGNNGFFQYDFTGDHLQMGLSLIPMIEKRSGNYQKKINISCKRYNNDYIVNISLYKK